MGRRPTVLLCTEGSYPFVGGGVSTWCDILCRELDEYEYITYAVTGAPEVSLKFELPTNAQQVLNVPLWGVSDPADSVLSDLSASELAGRRRHTTPEVIRVEFAPLLRRLMRRILGRGGPGQLHPIDDGRVMWELWSYFRTHDWRRTWKSELVWQVFSDSILAAYAAPGADGDPAAETPSVGEIANALRWLYHYLTPLSAPVPETDLVHTTIAGFPGLAGVIAKHERGTPMLVTEHGVWVRERYIAISASDFSLFEKRFLMDLSRYIAEINYACADLISPVTNFNRRWELPSGVDPARIETIFNGVDPGLFVPHRKPPETDGRPVVIAAARIFPLKDIETMIRSAQVVREALPLVEFRVYGSLDADVPYVERCRELIAELELEHTFKLAGHHSNPAELYTEGDVTALSSISEAFPYTVLESMSCARPVVGTDVGGVREALEGFGIIVPPRDHVAFGEALTLLLTDHRLRTQLGRQAREWVLSRFRVGGSVDGYRRVYERLLSATPTPPEPLALAA
jgi:glycosyltransferase involved in cell wall biosynthesis